MAQILSGKNIRDEIRSKLSQYVAGLDIKPVLVILQVGNRPDSESYISQKKKFADAIGASVTHKKYAEDVKESEILDDIKKYNDDKNVHGIILQLPIPEHLDKDQLMQSIDYRKDVDGMTPVSLKALLDNAKDRGFVPATARGIVTLLDYYNIEIAGKRAVVVGRSTLVGKPIALSLLNRNATVTVAHSSTKDLAAITKDADILIVAIGKPEFVTEKYVSPGQVVVDVGINNTGKMVGDVKQNEVGKIVKSITPVPGGVGPMTVASLFENLIDAHAKLAKKKRV